jgi:DNA-3-methyladenine glycosylase I
MSNHSKLAALTRCDWAQDAADPLMQRYHDSEWGVPQHDDRALFELLILEGAQAGLSWQTILRKRENYRKAFDGFDAQKIARYNTRKVETLMQDAGIVRNGAKIAAAIGNAKAFLAMQQEFGSFDTYIWRFVGGKPKRNRWTAMNEVPALTAESDAMSEDLKRRGFKFAGSTICYAFMQATGMVDDHLVTCHRHGAGSVTSPAAPAAAPPPATRVVRPPRRAPRAVREAREKKS